MTALILTTKLHVPPVHPRSVPRPRLLRRLDGSTTHKLTLLSAPAGFGKTALLSQWVARHSQRVAWLALSASDNDPVRFLAYVVTALQGVEAEIGESVLRALLSPQPPPLEGALTALINEIAASHAACTLILDDYHVITAQAIHDALAFLLDHMPPTLHLTVATRADPPLPLARLRAQGQLIELRASDLSFTVEEADAFLNQGMGLALTSEQVALLEARTEGWIAGLHMVALSMEGRKDISAFIHAFTGSDRYIMDYLLEEVFQRQREEVRTFLLRTSILERMTGTLCDALIGLSEGSSQTILEELERANLFIVPLDNERRWYRYHYLFADLLRARLSQTCPALEPDLHRRASEWFERNGLPTEAIDHSIAAGDLERAADLIAQNAEATLMRGELATFLRWTEALPDELIRAQPTLCLLRAWLDILSGQSLGTVEAWLQSAGTSDVAIAGGVTALHALMAASQGNASRTIELSTRALEQLPENQRFLRGATAWLLHASQLASNVDADDDQGFAEVLAMSRAAGNIAVAIMAECSQAEWLMRRGQLRRAARAYTRALELATDSHGQRLPLAGQALVGLGELAREWNDLSTAARHLQEGIHLSEEWAEVAPFDACISLARVRQAEGDEAGAAESIRKAEELAQRFDITELDDLVLAMFRARLWIAQGNLASAHRWAEKRDLYQYINSPLKEQTDDPYEHRLRKYELLVLARLLIAEGRPGEASKLLKPLVPIAKWRGRPGLLIEIHILQALASQALGDTRQAMTSLRRALALAEPEGYTRLFLDEGTPMIQLLRKLVRHDATATYAHKLLGALGPEAADKRKHDSVGFLTEPLSARELEILRLLRTHLTSTEMADELCISVNTVRYHIKNIYSKLGVHSRSEAAQRARELGLL